MKLNASGEAEAPEKTESDDAVDAIKADSSAENGGFTEEELNDTEKTRTLYNNSTGKALVIYKNADGTWVDRDGNTYEFVSDEDAYDQNSNSFYYHGEAANVYYM